MLFSSTYQPKRIPIEQQRFLVFVYGSLLSGFGNHRLLEEPETNVKFIGRASIRANLYTQHWGFPFILLSHSNKDRVLGEIYEVDYKTFRRLDSLEGYRRGRREKSSNHYNRKKVTATQLFRFAYSIEPENKSLKVWAYEGGDCYWNSYRGATHIASGDWKAAKTQYEQQQSIVILPRPRPSSFFFRNAVKTSSF